MKSHVFKIAAAALAIIIIAGALCNCQHNQPALPAADDFAPMVYYLHPGDPAPVEGPQLEARDFEILLAERERYIDELVRLTDEVAALKKQPEAGDVD